MFYRALTKIICFNFILLCQGFAFSFASECLPFGKNAVIADQNNKIQNYISKFNSCLYGNEEQFLLRTFILNNQKVALTLNPETLDSSIIRYSCLKSCLHIDQQDIRNSVYGTLLDLSTTMPYPLQNDGLTHGQKSDKVVLSIDMCPSSKGLSESLYKKLDQHAKRLGAKIPVVLAMTRAWIKRWPIKFQKLKNYHLNGSLEIEWINHSSNHRYKRSLPLSQNFLLMRGTDLKDETLGNEIAMIQSGVTPSLFFRFPGLVSNKWLIQSIRNFGHIVLGSNAWLAKGQKPQFGSLILIHGNRNEPLGEKKFLQYMSQMHKIGHQFGKLHEVLAF